MTRRSKKSKKVPSTARERLAEGRLSAMDYRAIARLTGDNRLAEAAAAIEAANRLADDLEADLKAARRGDWPGDLLDDDDEPLAL